MTKNIDKTNLIYLILIFIITIISLIFLKENMDSSYEDNKIKKTNMIY